MSDDSYMADGMESIVNEFLVESYENLDRLDQELIDRASANHRESIRKRWPELGPPLLLLGVLALYISRFLKRHLPLAVGDPLLEESQRFYI